MSILAVHPGTYYHIESLEGSRYRGMFDALARPEDLGDIDLGAFDAILVPCRTPASRMTPHKRLLADFLDAGGYRHRNRREREPVLAAGYQLFAAGHQFLVVAGRRAPISGCASSSPSIRCSKRIEQGDLTWHLHGWFEAPEGAEVLAVNGDGKPIFYIGRGDDRRPDDSDHASIPFYHHGSHFMPATTRFLDGFLPWLRETFASKQKQPA